jgi:RNA polymerase sigma-70 factor (ECF subfamily)
LNGNPGKIARSGQKSKTDFFSEIVRFQSGELISMEVPFCSRPVFHFCFFTPPGRLIMMHSNVPDVELVDRWREGDETAAGVLHKRYLAKLLNLVGRHLASRFNPRLDADDVVQSVFGSFFNGAREGRYEFDGDNDFWKLLLTIALNKVRNTVRHHQTQMRDLGKESFSTNTEGSERLLASLKSPGRIAAEYAGFLESLDELLDKLDPGEQELLRYQIEGYTQKEIADKMHLNDRTIRRMLARIRNRGLEMLDDA